MLTATLLCTTRGPLSRFMLKSWDMMFPLGANTIKFFTSWMVSLTASLMPVRTLSLVTLMAFVQTLPSSIVVSLIFLSPLLHRIRGTTVMFLILAVIVTSATRMARDGEMVPHTAHVEAEVRGRKATGTHRRRQVLMPVPTLLRNATLICGIEPLIVMSVRKRNKTPKGFLKILMRLPPIR